MLFFYVNIYSKSFQDDPVALDLPLLSPPPPPTQLIGLADTPMKIPEPLVLMQIADQCTVLRDSTLLFFSQLYQRLIFLITCFS